MAKISCILEDRPDGSVFYKFVSDTKLPVLVTELTPAQAFGIELKKFLDQLTGG